jgi:hypothetical protein
LSVSVFPLSSLYFISPFPYSNAKDWQSGNRTAEIRIDSLPAFIEIHPFYEEEFRREKENASRTEQGISLFLKEGRIVFFRIHEEACDD